MRLLAPNGRLVVLAPQGKSLFCNLDLTLGHKRRFSQSELEAMMKAHGLSVENVHQLAKTGSIAWRIFGKIGGQKQISKLWLKLFDKTVWFWRRVEALMPWKGLSIIIVGRKP